MIYCSPVLPFLLVYVFISLLFLSTTR
jgi:hypothetical protein